MENRTRARGTSRAAGWLAAAALTLAALPARAAPNTGRISFSAGADVTTAYFFRGILQERNGFILQPYGEVNINLYKADEGITGVTLFGGSWNSVQSQQTLSTGTGPENWYEADVYAGAKLSLFNDTELKAFYIAYTYPNGAFKTVQEVDFAASFNDSSFLGKFALNPSVLLAVETNRNAFGTEEGKYVELGIRPGGVLIDHESYPLSIAFPCKVGLSAGDYYETTTANDTFGFFQGGAELSVPLAFMPEDYGSWSVAAAASVYQLGSNLKTANLNDNPWVVGTWSLRWSY